jgi:flagellar biosynthesis chaperone FliJ
MFGLQTQLFASCDCSAAVTSAYMSQMSKLKNYYAELENKINVYTQEMDKFNKNYAATRQRRVEVLELLKLKKVAIAEQKAELQAIGMFLEDFSLLKNNITKTEILLKKD